MNNEKVSKYLLFFLAVSLPISISGSQIAILLLTFTIIYRIIKEKSLNSLVIPHPWILFILLIAPAFSLLNAENMDFALKWYKRYVYILTIFIVASSFRLSENKTKKLIGAYVLTASVAAVIGILQPFIGKSFELPFNIKTYYVFSTGFISQSNAFAEIMTYSAIAAIYLLKIAYRNNEKILLSTGLIAMYFSVIFTRARISILLLSALLLTSIPIILKKKSIYFFSIILIIILCLSPISKRVFWRFDTILSIHQSRVELWEKSFEIFKEYPLVGCGIGNLHNNLEKKKETIKNKKILDLTHAHNNILDFMATMGLVGTFSFILFWFIIFKDIIEKIRTSTMENKPIFIAIFTILSAFHFIGIINCNYKTSITSFQLYLFIGIFYGIAFNKKFMQKNPEGNQ